MQNEKKWMLKDSQKYFVFYRAYIVIIKVKIQEIDLPFTILEVPGFKAECRFDLFGEFKI